MNTRLMILAFVLLLTVKSTLAIANITTSPEQHRLNATAQLEMLDLLADAEEKLATLDVTNASDETITNIVNLMAAIVYAGDFSETSMFISTSSDKMKRAQFESYIYPTTGRRTLRMSDYVTLHDLFNSIDLRLQDLDNAKLFFEFMNNELIKYENDTDIVVDEDKREFDEARRLYDQRNFTSAAENLLAIKTRMDLKGLANLRQGYNTMEDLRKNNFSISLVRDIFDSARDEYATAYFDAILNSSNVSQDQGYQDFIHFITKDLERRPGDEYIGIDYKSARDIIKEIDYLSVQIHRINESIDKIKQKIAFYGERGVNTTEAQTFFNNGLQSFHEDRYDEAETLLTKADSSLELGLAKLAITGVMAKESIGFVQKHKIVLSTIALFLVIFGPVIFRRVRHSIICMRINNQKMEHEVLIDLIKKAQQDRFQAGTIDDPTYHIKLDKYMERISKIKSTLPVIENIKKRIEKPTYVERFYYAIKTFILRAFHKGG